MSDQHHTSPGDNRAQPDWGSARRLAGGGLLSVVMPMHNLEHVASGNIAEVRNAFSGILPFEIVAVDDGSSDGTARKLREAAASVPELRPVFLGANAGKGAALARGFEASRGTFILLLDGDLDLHPSQAARLFDVMESAGADAVIGSKLHPGSAIASYPWHRRLSSAVYYAMVKLLVGLPVRDTQTGIKLFKRPVLETAFPRLLVKQFAFDLELLSVAHLKGYRIAESPVELSAGQTWGWVKPSAVRQIIHDTLAIFYRVFVLRYYQSLRDAKMPAPPPLVSVIVAYPAPSAYLDECLEGISRQTYANYEVILLPDVKSGRSFPPGVREIPTGKIRPAEKRNIGAEAARGEILAFLDDDAFPAEDWLRRAVVYFGDPAVAAVGGPAVTPPADSYMAGLSGRVYANRLVSGQYRCRYVPGLVRDVDDFPSCNLLVRSGVMKEAGGFRTDYWPGEDTYLCRDIIHKLKLRILYDPRVLVFHHRRALFLPHLRQIARYALHRGYFARHFPETSRRLSYAMPTLFVAGLVAGPVLAAFCRWCGILYLSAVGLYAILTLLSCFSFNPATWLLTWLGVVATHLVYGVRFAAGLLARRLPGEVRKFDHPSEKQ